MTMTREELRKLFRTSNDISLKYEVNFKGNVSKEYKVIQESAETLILDKLTELSISENTLKNSLKILTIIKSLTRNPYIKTWYDVERVKIILSEDINPRPDWFKSKTGEILNRIKCKINKKRVSVHHGHVNYMGTYSTIYWCISPVDSNVILVLLIDEHPKEYDNNLLEPKLTDNNVDSGLLKRSTNNYYDKTLQLQNSSNFSLVSKNNVKDRLDKKGNIKEKRENIGAIYKDSKNFYFFIHREDDYIYFQISKEDIKTLENSHITLKQFFSE